VSSAAKLRVCVLVFAAALIGGGLSWSPENARSATQFNIVLLYDETGDAVDPCDLDPSLHTCGHTGDLALILEAAAQHWENIFEDSHEILIRYRWVDDSLPSATIVEVDANGRPIEALLKFPADPFPDEPGFTYFYDPTPFEDEEFFMQPRLYRTVHEQEQEEAFLFNALSQQPPEVFEVSYNGLELSGQGNDLLTQALHEMGHALGMANQVIEARPVPECTEGVDPWYDLDPALTGGRDFELRAFNGSSGDDCPHLDLGGITECKPPPGDQNTTSSDPSTVAGLSIAECTAHQALLWVSQYPSSRMRPGTADILTIALAAGWEEINLPRKYSLEGGLWNDDATWLGDRVPDGDDHVFIVNQESSVAINAFSPGTADNLTITDGNTLNVFDDFYIGDMGSVIRLVGEGTALTADTGSNVDGRETIIGSGALLSVWIDGFFNSFYITNFGEIRGGAGGGGVGTLDVVVLDNYGLIRGNGGLLNVTSTSIDTPFDLDGQADTANAQLQALVGDIAFNGGVTDDVLANIQVGPGRYITFAEGWTQQLSFNPLHVLTMSGGDFEATINGHSTLNGQLVVNQIARFTSDVELGPGARFDFSVEGLTPGSGHDQLIVDGEVDLNGGITVELLPGFAPMPNDRYTLMTYGSRTGQFVAQVLPALDGGLTLLLDYTDTQLDLLVGFAGADPDAPNCTGQAAATQAQEHGGMKNAAEALGYPSVAALQAAIDEFCGE